MVEKTTTFDGVSMEVPLTSEWSFGGAAMTIQCDLLIFLLAVRHSSWKGVCCERVEWKDKVACARGRLVTKINGVVEEKESFGTGGEGNGTGWCG